MYTLINEAIPHLIAAEEKQRNVLDYTELRRLFREEDACRNKVFQDLYRRFWAMNAARLSRDFVKGYFDLLHELRADREIAVEQVARRLNTMPSHGNHRYSLQFSFASKLVHMLAPQKPVYDERVRSFYFLPGPRGKGFEAKLACALDEYRFLDVEYGRVLKTGLLDEAIAAFTTAFDPGHACTGQKIIDTLIWHFVSLLRRNALQKGQVAYA